MTANTTCLENLSWSLVSLNCSIPSCLSQPPPLKNANVSDGSQLVGSIRTYTCHHGYRDTSGNETTANTTCLGNITWSRVALKCLVPSCLSEPPRVKNANVSDGSQLVGSIRTYTCHHGYRDTSTERCPSKLPTVQNADVSRGSRTVGSSRKYTCHRGYRDKSNGLNITQTRCLQSLRWSPPNRSCSAESCPSKLPTVINAYVNSSRGSRTVGSSRTYMCYRSYGDKSTALRCPSKLPTVQNADVSRGNRNVGCSRKYTCHRGYRDKSTGRKIGKARCLKSLRWSPPNLSCSVIQGSLQVEVPRVVPQSVWGGVVSDVHHGELVDRVTITDLTTIACVADNLLALENADTHHHHHQKQQQE
ncbi:sushi, von Willebrand factor type A, EGF and pentraxin domain-containing protein 1-like [Haliotis rubra]|uniref:sushi, von Willebrand factor type A, EGF and pentraxin domain-containing protein 1-like n=1 Tax=Haliotis rubra TaxID=36100 RepID=UPI001EE5BF26|nr:sushi, von Willebrand factor type A, EGF and pentraxin domain-containing protein 1-like [Haliotis rubra]